jgi:hypothetical protein
VALLIAALSLIAWGGGFPSTPASPAPTLSADGPFGGWSVQRPEAIDWEGACCRVRGEWRVALEGDRVTVRGRTWDEKDPLPFEPKDGEGEIAGRRHVLPVEGGYLVGFDHGEFGGGVWWFSADGSRSRELTLRASDSLADWIPENVHAFGRLGPDVMAFEGLTHLFGNLGRVVRLRRDVNGEWRPSLFTKLAACPHAALEESSGTWLLATTTGVWRLDARARQHRVWRPPGGHLYYPSSIVRDHAGIVYMGLRNVVVRLTPDNRRGYSVDVLVPPSR